MPEPGDPILTGSDPSGGVLDVHDLAVDDLRLFAWIADEGGLSGAMRRHGFPKASLSRAVARLEAAAGAPLFDRTGRGLRPTPLGETLLPAARLAVTAARDAEEALRSATGEPAGSLRVAASALAAHKLINGVLGDLITRHPSVRPELHITSRPIDPLAEDFDVTLQIGRPSQPSLIARRMLEATLGLYAHPDALLGIDPNEPDEVAMVGRIVVRMDGLPGDWTLTHRERGHAIVLDAAPTIGVSDPTVAFDMLRAGHGMMLVPRIWGEGIVAGASLVPVLPEWDGPTIEIFAVMPPRRANVPAVRAFLDLMFEQARALGSKG